MNIFSRITVLFSKYANSYHSSLGDSRKNNAFCYEYMATFIAESKMTWIDYAINHII